MHGYHGHRIRKDARRRIVNPQVFILRLSYSFSTSKREASLLLARHVSLEFWLQTLGKRNQVVTYRSCFCDRIGQRNVGNLRAAKHPQPAEFAFVHQIDGSRSITRGKHSIISRRSASTLSV